MNKIVDFLKRPQVWGFGVSVVVLALLALAFFYPDNFDHNSLQQPDMQQGAANGHEAQTFEQQTGEKALWTNSLFGGMPTFQIAPSYPSNSLFNWINAVYGLGLPAPSNLLFMMMFGFLILLYCLRMRWYYALIGAVAWGFSSYFIIIIGAGHIWKFVALAYIPPTIGGFLLLFRGHRWTGTAILALFAMMQLNANHPQMTYYFGLLMAIMAVCYLIDAIRRHTVRNWLKACGLALGAGALALGANAPSLYNTYEYAKETKRSQSELTPERTDDAQSPAERPTGGMPREQIVGWSYGRAEMFSLIVPNIKGGASARPEGGQMTPMGLDRLDDAAEYAQSSPIIGYMSQYFNDSEGTNGPVYAGIIIFALFLTGCFVVRGPLKWALVAGTIMSVLLALGRNAEGLTDFMIYNFPLYNKFRAVESILVVAEFTMPLLAMLCLAQLVEAGHEALSRHGKALAAGFGFPAAVCLLAVAAPSVFGSAITNNDKQSIAAIQEQVAQYGKSQGAGDQQINQLLYQYSFSNPDNVRAVEDLRYGMVRADGLRSLMFLLIAAGVLALFFMGTIKRGLTLAAIGAFVLGDLYTLDKRYVSHSSFTTGTPTGEIVLEPDNFDRAIMADTTSHYRVLDLPGFFQADRSYFHKTIGGYHAAKLSRYDDLIQRKMMPMLQMGFFPDDPQLDDPAYADIARRLRTAYRVADMLNARYVITGDAQAPLIRNNHALGNAWLVDSLAWVDNADAEMAALDASQLDLTHQAVADRRFAHALPGQAPALAPGDSIYLTSYSPNRLTYHATTANGGVGVFSEVYFPWGWHATVNGKETPLARVNYVLRAIELPTGDSTIVMTFDPQSIHTSSNVAYACVSLIYLLLLSAAFSEIKRRKLL